MAPGFNSYQRRSIRMSEYDYKSPGRYFITISTCGKIQLFGDVMDSTMITNDAGMMVERLWRSLPVRFLQISTEVSKVMPNHFHGILVINQKTNRALGEYIGAFKSLTTREYITGVTNQGWQPFSGHLWMDNYYEHIIRDEDDYHRIIEYIQDNALKWSALHDEELP